MEFEGSPFNKSKTKIRIIRPHGFSAEWGPIALDISKRYVVYCEDHKIIVGRTSLPKAKRASRRPHQWCHYCSLIFKAWEKAENERAIARAIRMERLLYLRAQRLRPVHPTLGKFWHEIQARWEARAELIDRIEANRAIAAEILAKRIESGEKLPRWKIGRAKRDIAAQRAKLKKDKNECGEQILLVTKSNLPACPSDELRAKLETFKFP